MKSMIGKSTDIDWLSFFNDAFYCRTRLPKIRVSQCILIMITATKVIKYWIFFCWQQLDDEILQKIAKEMNLSETAFILEKNEQESYSRGQRLNYAVKLIITIINFYNYLPCTVTPFLN